ncbi:hypothetical protein EDD21DRAFT_385206 [Dissophora ornata]|nr:hypothetical protein EDD21DRAFT_385206 [Dissophora ornata]
MQRVVDFVCCVLAGFLFFVFVSSHSITTALSLCAHYLTSCATTLFFSYSSSFPFALSRALHLCESCLVHLFFAHNCFICLLSVLCSSVRPVCPRLLLDHWCSSSFQHHPSTHPSLQHVPSAWIT